VQPLVAQDPGQTALLLARVAALGLVALRVRPVGRARVAVLVVVAALFVASLVARDLGIAEVVVALVVADRLATSPWPRAARVGAPVAVLLLAAASLRPHAPYAPEAAPTDAPQAVAYWRARGNLFHARAEALRWANGEPAPAEGYLALAEVDWALGDGVRARKVLAKVVERGASDAVRARAQEMGRSWGPAAP
jgi:hypothetical protein